MDSDEDIYEVLKYCFKDIDIKNYLEFKDLLRHLTT